MQFTPPRLLFVLCVMAFVPASWIAGETAGTANARSRRHAAPRSIGRAADPHGLPAGPAVSGRQAAVVRRLTYETPGESALAMIRFPWQALGYDVAFRGRRPGYRALTFVEENRIEVYVKSDEPPRSLAYDLAHEFGHVVDLKLNDETRRKRWLEMRGIDPGTPWYGRSGLSDFDTPAGDFAETFAYLLLGPGSYYSRMAPPPRPEQVRELAEFCGIEHVNETLLPPAETDQASR